MLANNGREFVSIPLVIAIFLATAVCPAYAGTLYMDGSPDLTIAIAGINEFTPGDDMSIPLVISNTGLNKYQYVSPSIMSRDVLPSTAKHVIVTLAPGNAPVTITSDSRMAGDVPGGSSVTVAFNGKVNSNASSGVYTMMANINYTYLKMTEQFGTDAMLYTYTTEKITLPVPITIKPEVTIDVIEAIPDHVNVGAEGYLEIRIRNTGSEDGRNAVLRISRNGESPIIPLESSVFIGDFSPGSTASCRYRIMVTPGAEESTYPVDIAVFFENQEGDTVVSGIKTIGIPVGRKTAFTVVSPPVAIHPGQKKTVTIMYRNTGIVPVYSAQGRIIAVEPFTSSNDIVYLGDVAPGASVVAEYQIRVDSGATAKKYGLDTEIRFQDSSNTTYVSNMMKIGIDVTDQEGLSAILENPVMLGLGAVAIGIVIFVTYRYRKKKT